MQGGPRKNAGRKPGIKETVPRGSARPRILARHELKRKWLKALEMAESKGNVDAYVRALTAITETQHGRPYVAKDPAEAQKANLLNDPKLQDAVAKLLGKGKPQQVVSKPEDEAKTIMSSTKQIESKGVN